MTLTAVKTTQQMESLVNHIGWAGCSGAEHVSEIQNLKKKKKLVFFNFQWRSHICLDKLFPGVDHPFMKTCPFHYISPFVPSIVLMFIICWGPQEFGFILVLFLQDHRSPKMAFRPTGLFLWPSLITVWYCAYYMAAQLFVACVGRNWAIVLVNPSVFSQPDL